MLPQLNKFYIEYVLPGFFSEQSLCIEKEMNVAVDKIFFPMQKCLYFSYFSTKTYVVGTYQKRLDECGTSYEYLQHTIFT